MEGFALLFLFVGILLAGLMVVGGGIGGRIVERRHLAHLETREAELAGIFVSDLATPVGPHGRGTLVTGSVVLGVDNLRMLVLGLVNIVGGGAPQVDRVMQRARREAMVRMKAEAASLGASEVVNVRIETSTISGDGGRSNRGSGEVFCHGTAIVPHR